MVPGRALRALALVAGSLMAALATLPPTAMAVPSIMGGQLYYTGGDVTVDVVSSNTAYTEVLQLRSALEVLDITNNREVGTRVTLTEEQFASWGIGVGDELMFGIQVQDTDKTFLMGAGSRNADGLAHANVSHHGAAAYYVELEDLYGGGDLDYNDTVLRFSGGVTGSLARLGPTANGVAEPSSLILFLAGAGLLVLAANRRSQA